MASAVAVACYGSDLEVEHDVKTLARGAFDMALVCVIGKDWAPQNEIAFLHTGRTRTSQLSTTLSPRKCHGNNPDRKDQARRAVR